MPRKKYGKKPYTVTRYYARRVACQKALRHCLRAAAAAQLTSTVASVSYSPGLSIAARAAGVAKAMSAFATACAAIDEMVPA